MKSVMNRQGLFRNDIQESCRKVRSMWSHRTAPSRRRRGGDEVTSTTVEGALAGSAPASIKRSIPSERALRISPMLFGVGSPARFALVEVIGLPHAWTSARQKSLDGTLAPTVPVPAVISG